MSPDIYAPRVALKPFEFPEVRKCKDDMQKSSSTWTFHHWDFISDVQDYKTSMTDSERQVIKRTLLAISQVEVAIKELWLKVGERFPKPEFKQIGICFAESEIRHQDAYSQLLDVLDLNHEFDVALSHPSIKGRIDYLSKYIKSSPSQTHQEFIKTLTLFSIFVENVSLFSQFLIARSFNKYTNRLKDIANVVQATAREEQLHALFGCWLVNKVRDQHPEWFDDQFYQVIDDAVQKAYKAEEGILDWIFEDGDLSFLTKADVLNFIKKRFNYSIELIKMDDKITKFEVDEDLLPRTKWFEESILITSLTDFFYKTPTEYSKGKKTIQVGDLFND